MKRTPQRLSGAFLCSGLGLPLSLVVRLIEKVVLDGTGWVQLRHPGNGGGLYYCFNAVMMHISCFVAAALYSAYSTGIAPDSQSFSAIGDNRTGANLTNATARVANTSASFPANAAAADNGETSSSKLDDFTLYASIGMLSAVYTMAFVALLLTMKRPFAYTFFSLQTGCAFSQSHFLDHAGNDARRSNVFFNNERHWRSIRHLVRQWVLGLYATWEALKPAWFTDHVKTCIPDSFMPTEAVQHENARAPGGRRLSLEDMGVLRRASLALSGSDAAQDLQISEAVAGDDV